MPLKEGVLSREEPGMTEDGMRTDGAAGNAGFPGMSVFERTGEAARIGGAAGSEDLLSDD